ncbi:MAG: hypothetical protein CMC87_00930 [Flavobacteriaceae bacterium]|nr:hypothetical protein [Flavobacteriaceae bacterium]|tara:strand:- start:12068 stop:13990 length:1923 start_codon:yes stop_codon:yes gene_type:complete
MNMKAIKNIKLIVILALATFVLDACVQDDDFQTPVIEIEEPDVTVNYTLQEIKDAIQANNGEPFIIQAESNDPVYVEAYVVSDDEAGNIYQKIYVQDKPENPEVGMAISTFATDVYPIYAKGRKVYIRVDGLAAASSNGMPSIGADVDSQYGVTRIAQERLRELVLISTTMEEIVPTEVTVSELQSDQHLATLVKLNNVQFANPDQNYTSNNQTTNITFEDCEGNSSYLRNSNYADFADTPLPNGNGTIEGIAAVYNSDYQLFINSSEDVDLNGDRCGGYVPIEALELPFEEGFENATVGSNVNIEGWANVNVTGGEKVFSVAEFDNNSYAQISAYNSDESSIETWLVTPGLAVGQTTDPVLSFDTKDGYNNGDALSVFITTEFDGDPSNSSWTEVNATLSTGNSTGYANSFTNSGEIDLSAYANQVIYVGFKYEGGSDGVTTTFQIDNVYAGTAQGDGGGTTDPEIVEPPFNEDFEAETAGTGESVSINGWTNVNANGGSRVFEVREFDGNKYAQTSAYNSDENPYEAWLVMPGVDLSNSTSATLSFATKDGYYNGTALTTYISTDFDGDVNNATWTEITGVTYSTGNTSGYADSFVPSGDIDLSAYAGQTVYVAFQYLGASDGVTSTYQIDNISLTAN